MSSLIKFNTKDLVIVSVYSDLGNEDGNAFCGGSTALGYADRVSADSEDFLALDLNCDWSGQDREAITILTLKSNLGLLKQENYTVKVEDVDVSEVSVFGDEAGVYGLFHNSRTGETVIEDPFN